ncbi:phospholipase A and acyltransferase 4-like [Engraulis encrasicolus]|uniref:phospholipase A and acyltransferase 4-like n=1 Tax=Engraulis encrasicolus TaxID=184585 RepID=UPI002FD699BA
MADEENPKAGDLIEVFRLTYQHWAVYIGEGYVIHLASPDQQAMGSASVTSPIAIVKKEKLEDVVNGNDWKVNNILDNEYQPRPIEDIIKDAIAMEGKTVPYKITSANCEHFATNLRYGKAESRQVRNTGYEVTYVKL